MRLPFANKKGFTRLPGEEPACEAVFFVDEINKLLERKSNKVCNTAARFLGVPETEIVQKLQVSDALVNIVFKSKPQDLYEWDDADED